MENIMRETCPPDPTLLALAPGGWRAEPDFRGSFNILSTCLSTLAICVWNAVHVDIPERKSGFKSSMDKIGWLFVGILAPELLLYIAFNQLCAANQIRAHAKKCFHVPPPTSGLGWIPRLMGFLSRAGKRLGYYLPKASGYLSIDDDDPQTGLDVRAASAERNADQDRKHPWTRIHGFYAAMGGFVIDASSGDPFLPGNSTRLVLTPSGINFIMDHAPGLLPDISEDDIRDRSKADGLAKALLVWQVLYFCIGCVSRLIQGLPMSLLEISTLAHCMCTILTYALWWNKPLNVGKPSLINKEGSRELGALLYMGSNSQKYLLVGTICFPWISELQTVTFSRSRSAAALLDGSSVDYPGAGTLAIQPGQFIQDAGHFTPRDMERSWRPFSMNHVWGRLFSSIVLWATFGSDSRPWFTRPHFLPPYIRLRHHDITRWRLASKAVETYGYHDINPELSPVVQHPPFVTLSTELRTSVDRNMTGFTAIARTAGAAMVLTAIYGIPHLLGLTATFPTQLESTLWRAATIAITSLGAIGGTLVVALYGIMKLFSIDMDSGKMGLGSADSWFVFISAVVYISSSVYLVAESFRQLFALPDGVFLLPSWSNYWPHFS